jgi:DNA-binding response OmpR family regulator
VDDNRDGADSLLLILQAYGLEPRVAYDGESGLRLARSFRPDVVLLDLGMPGLDGYEVARRLRREEGLHDALLVALTGWGEEEARRLSAESGFDVYLPKPADLGELQRLLADAAARPAPAGAA